MFLSRSAFGRTEIDYAWQASVRKSYPMDCAVANTGHCSGREARVRCPTDDRRATVTLCLALCEGTGGRGNSSVQRSREVPGAAHIEARQAAVTKSKWPMAITNTEVAERDSSAAAMTSSALVR